MAAVATALRGDRGTEEQSRDDWPQARGYNIC